MIEILAIVGDTTLSPHLHTIPELYPSKGVCADNGAGADAAAVAAGAKPDAKPDVAADDEAAKAADARSARRWAGCKTPGSASADT